MFFSAFSFISMLSPSRLPPVISSDTRVELDGVLPRHALSSVLANTHYPEGALADFHRLPVGTVRPVNTALFPFLMVATAGSTESSKPGLLSVLPAATTTVRAQAFVTVIASLVVSPVIS